MKPPPSRRTLCGRGGFNTDFHAVEVTRTTKNVTCELCLNKMKK